LANSRDHAVREAVNREPVEILVYVTNPALDAAGDDPSQVDLIQARLQLDDVHRLVDGGTGDQNWTAGRRKSRVRLSLVSAADADGTTDHDEAEPKKPR